jgi:FAD dependent oxidoreductase TIGR03364
MVGVVGAGIVGLAHAWLAAERGHRVIVFERTPLAQGASVRNFGMVWPIGQPTREWHQVALRSRARWLRLADDAQIRVNPCGAIHLAHRLDEWVVLEEFAARAADLGAECELLTADQVLRRTPAANPAGLLGGLYTPTELAVNPPVTVRTIARWLAERYTVQFRFDTVVTRVTVDPTPVLETASGERYPFARIVVCSGADTQTLFPSEYATAGLRACKLQMLKTGPQPGGWRIGPHLAGGLTLRHYANFEICPSLPRLRARIASEAPELDRYGIHVMASQPDSGEVILGDSHEYEPGIEPFDQSIIDDLILRELRKIITLPDWGIVSRWHGIYVKRANSAAWEAEPLPNVYLFSGMGGSGMTMAFGLAERAWARWPSLGGNDGNAIPSRHS